jgi:rubrerythrin
LLDTKPGLPCSDCGTATELTLSEIWGCEQCGAQREQHRHDGRLHADPGQCPWCNP